jgi:hypothetical protein
MAPEVGLEPTALRLTADSPPLAMGCYYMRLHAYFLLLMAIYRRARLLLTNTTLGAL